jgi:DNA-binding transcriptional ArsR family regulator
VNKLFKALNNNTRREILDKLREGDMTAGEIADMFDISKPSISHHLDILKQAELLESQRNGQFIHYSLNTTVMDDIINWFLTFKSQENEK